MFLFKGSAPIIVFPQKQCGIGILAKDGKIPQRFFKIK